MSRVIWRREVEHASASRFPLTRLLQRRRQDKLDEAYASRLVDRWMATAAGAGLARDTESCAGIPGITIPQVVSVVLGDPDRLVVRMTPGQVVADYQREARRIAEGLGVDRVRVELRSHGLVRIDLQPTDPLNRLVEGVVPIRSAIDRVSLGGLETGETLRVALAEIAHMIVQGQTRSGKSRFLYGLLAQLAGADDVLVCGSDITGLLLRPFAGTRHDQYLALGAQDVTAHATALEELVAVMDDRIARMPARRDVYPCSSDEPYLLTIVEELPGLLKAADSYDATYPPPRGQPKLAARIRAAYGRLVAEGAKVGVRLVLITQRAEASIVGAFERGQATLRVSFAVENADSVQMLHPTVDRDAANEHVVSQPGRALVTAPGLPAIRLRSPQMGDYGEYTDRIHHLCPPDADGDTGTPVLAAA